MHEMSWVTFRLPQTLVIMRDSTILLNMVKTQIQITHAELGHWVELSRAHPT